MDTEKEVIVKYEGVDLERDGNTILSDINLTIREGDFVYLIGKVGSGKSTLLKSMYHEIALVRGTGKVLDYELENIKKKQIPYLRRKVGIVFQDFQLFPDRNVNENMLFVLKATGWTDKTEMQVKIDEVLQRVGMVGLTNKMPHQLSGGEQQRVAIARALLNDPELILADEPTGNLDPQTSAEILAVLKKINDNGKTVIMATHDYAVIMKFPAKTLKCEDNTIFEVVQKTV